jgi:hypothetical protein
MRFPSLLPGLLLAAAASAQIPGLTLPTSGNVQKAAVTQFIGPVQVTIEYSSPKVHGPGGADRRGKIWGELVPFGMADLGFPPGRLSPWRAGANENTVFSVSHPVLINGKPLPAGRYGLHVMVASPSGSEDWTLIFSRNSTSWGSFSYDAAEDALRLPIRPRKHEYREHLTYEFVEREPAQAIAELQWEDIALPWTIRVENIEDVYISQLRNELRNAPGFSWQSYNAAVQYALGANKHLDTALQWADGAISFPFVGQANFVTLSAKASVLSKLGREAEAEPLRKQALNHPTATMIQIHQYGRQLLAAGRKQEALDVFLLNAKRNGDVWPINVGLARGYLATGDNAKALEHARKAVAQAPDALNKRNLEAMVQAISEGKPFNN